MKLKTLLVVVTCSVLSSLSYGEVSINEQGLVSDVNASKTQQQPAPETTRVDMRQMPNQDIWAPVHVPNHWVSNASNTDNFGRADKSGGLLR